MESDRIDGNTFGISEKKSIDFKYSISGIQCVKYEIVSWLTKQRSQSAITEIGTRTFSAWLRISIVSNLN